jgi:hypothetical protein
VNQKPRDALTNWIGEQLTAQELLGLLTEEQFHAVARRAVSFLGPPEEPKPELGEAVAALGQIPKWQNT